MFNTVKFKLDIVTIDIRKILIGLLIGNGYYVLRKIINYYDV